MFFIAHLLFVADAIFVPEQIAQKQYARIQTITSVTINTKQTTRKPADQREHARKMVSPPDHLDFFVG